MKDRDSFYYTAREAQHKLGLSKAKFHRWVRQGLIPRVVLPGMKQGTYPKRDVDALALSLHEHIQIFDFSPSSPADLAAQIKIAQKCFGYGFTFPLAQSIAFQQKCKFAYYSLKVRGEVVGYIALFPLPERLLENLLTGYTLKQEITVADILTFERLEPMQIYLDDIAVDPDLPAHIRHLYAGLLLYYSIDMIFLLYTQNYQITDFYALAYTPEGEELLKKLNFQIMPGKSLIANRPAYIYHCDTQTVEILQALRTRFRRHDQLHI